ncbi:MAG: fucose isomerase [Clostridiales bacterium]|nr:fucose isomerase [Clostridiales bacterium]
MLKGIPAVVSPDLIKILMEMGHGDELVLGDGNFPSAAYAKRLVRCDGHGVPVLLDAILGLIPLDSYVSCPVALMAVADGDNTPKPSIWDTYEDIIKKHEQQAIGVEYMERFAFYERAKAAYAVCATGESAIYANIILKKGVIK